MRMDRDAAGAGPIVTGLGPGGFRLGETWHRSVLLTVDAAYDWTPPPLELLALADLRMLVDARPEFVLLGTGGALSRPSPALVAALEAADIGLEAMDSRAAARAWGVLRSEGRQIAAAFYPL